MKQDYVVNDNQMKYESIVRVVRMLFFLFSTLMRLSLSTYNRMHLPPQLSSQSRNSGVK